MLTIDQIPHSRVNQKGSLITGLYAESHGIVANDFWDPKIEKEFIYTHAGKSWDSYWWGGEPVSDCYGATIQPFNS